MASNLDALDVAEIILSKIGTLSAMKLQKLVYYSQAWSLVWDEKPLFDEEIEAWANGPVVRRLFDAHRGQYIVSPGALKRSHAKPDAAQSESIDVVLDYYGGKSPQWLSDLTHNEDPWKVARSGIPDGERGNEIITKESLLEYYSSLYQ